MLNGSRGFEMENLRHVPSEEGNLRTDRLFSSKFLIYIRHEYTSTKQLSPSSSQWTYYLHPDWTCLSVLLAHENCPPQTLSALSCSLLQHVFPELLFLRYSQINLISSIGAFLSLPLIQADNKVRRKSGP